jgi:hypothetical protein
VFVFADDSYGFASNGTYYAADGSFYDFITGEYISPEGVTSYFSPDWSGSSSTSTTSATSSINTSSGDKTNDGYSSLSRMFDTTYHLTLVMLGLATVPFLHIY